MTESFSIAATAQKALSKRKTLYAHPPMSAGDGDGAWFHVLHDGFRYKVTVACEHVLVRPSPELIKMVFPDQ